MTGESVFPDWMSELPFQQQCVLALALRGPDGIAKYHPMKEIQRCYRGTVVKAAERGRLLHLDEEADSFMSMHNFGKLEAWLNTVRTYFFYVDQMPHHFHMHLMHAAEILGYNHPDEVVRDRWLHFYMCCCDDAHVPPESKEDMNRRLNDFGRHDK